MATIIPFITQLTKQDEQAWLSVLRPLLADYDLLPLSEITHVQSKTVEVAIVANPRPKDLDTLPHLKWVQSLWAGVERLLTETSGNDFAIVRMTDPALAETMAEAVLAWTFYLHRDMPRYQSQQAARVWQQHPLPLPSERVVGILGMGKLGTAAAQRLVQQGFTVWGWGRSPTGMVGIKTIVGNTALHQELQRTQILVCLLPLTSSTRGLLNHQTLGLLRSGASLINFARGPIVDTKALIDQLDCGHLNHAVLDVFAQEPLPPSSPLWSHPNITILPHIAAPTNRKTASQIVAQNIRHFFLTGEIPPIVDRRRGY